MTVAHHGFLYSNEVNHPIEMDGVRIGEIVDRRPELDVAFMWLTSSGSISSQIVFIFRPKSPRATFVKLASPREFFWFMKSFSIMISNFCIAFSIHRFSRGRFVFGNREKLSWFLLFGGHII